jgi:hypothetical protein
MHFGQMFDITMQSPANLQAIYLEELWHRLSVQHIALGCTCTMSGISVTLEDFERDIADYLWAEAERLKQLDVVDFLLLPGPMKEQQHAIRDILARIKVGLASPEAADWLTNRLTKTLESYAKLHGQSFQAPLMGGALAWRKGYRND